MQRQDAKRGRRWRGRPTAALLAAVGALALAAGCGGDDESTSATTQQGNGGGQQAANGNGAAEGNGSQAGRPSSPSGEGAAQTGFVAEANAACQKQRAELQKAGKKVFREYFSKPGAKGAEVMARTVIIPTFEKQLADLSELEPPEGEAEQVAELEEAIRRMLAQLRQDPTANEFYPYTEAEAAADEVGLTSCGRP